MIHLKIIKTETNVLVNFCDSDLIGTKFNGNTISKNYYGEPATNEKVIQAIKQATTINSLGEESVNLLCSIHKGLEVIEIEGIPHTQVFTTS